MIITTNYKILNCGVKRVILLQNKYANACSRKFSESEIYGLQHRLRHTHELLMECKFVGCSKQQENRPCGVDKSEHMFTKWQPIKSDVCTRTFQLLLYFTNFLSVILPVCLTFLKQISYLYYSSCKN